MYSKEVILKAAEIGEISMIDAKHLVSLLDEAKTIINTVDNDNFDNHQAESFIMQDGDVYLLKVENTHRVNSLVAADSGIDRYLITYTVVTKN
mgnify:CR=1 FL=1